MEQLSKKVQRAQFFQSHLHLFRCPYCGGAFTFQDQLSLICSHRHTFDLSKQGTVNLLVHHVHSEYDQELFVCRRRIMQETDFFQPLLERLAAEINRYWSDDDKKGERLLLDAGCGEGTHLTRLLSLLKQSGHRASGIGVDIAKEGIHQAAKNSIDAQWLIADLAHPPFSSHIFDGILNILSPSNYEAFSRILKPSGWLIKVVPASDYLKELRIFFRGNDGGRTYSNADVLAHFNSRFPDTNRFSITYTRHLEGDQLFDLMRMTPLSWRASESLKEQWVSARSRTLTVDLTVLMAKNIEIEKS